MRLSICVLLLVLGSIPTSSVGAGNSSIVWQFQRAQFACRDDSSLARQLSRHLTPTGFYTVARGCYPTTELAVKREQSGRLYSKKLGVRHQLFRILCLEVATVEQGTVCVIEDAWPDTEMSYW